MMSILIILALFSLNTSAQPIVRLHEGLIEGKTVLFNERNISQLVDVFLGVPFAEPPIRFGAPVPKTPWSGVLDTTSFKPACMQTRSKAFPNVDEDCLYLNVYSPNPKPSQAGVLVYIHGGTFRAGTAMRPHSYGVPLVAVGNVILVSINYRLGIFSRFSTGTYEARGNYGMLDQVEALRWIQRNIGAFGGDGDQVTLMGFSAGAGSVNFHLLSRLSRGLFSQAIMQSGNVFSPWAFKNVTPEEDRKKAEQLGLSMGCPTTSIPDMIECLRTTKATILTTTANTIYNSEYPIHVDGLFLEDTPSNLYRLGEFKVCPLLAGYSRDEGTTTLRSFYREHLHQRYRPQTNLKTAQDHVISMMALIGYNGTILRDAALEMYTDWSKAADGDFTRTYIDVYTDVFYACTTDRVIRAHSSERSKIFKYIFTHEPTASKPILHHGIADVSMTLPTPWLNATHGADTMYVFGRHFMKEFQNPLFNYTEENKALSVQIMKYWTNFAKSSDPNKSSRDDLIDDEIEPWFPFTTDGLIHKELSPTLRNGRAARAKECHFLNVYMPQLKSATKSITEDEQQWKQDYKSWQEYFISWRDRFEHLNE
nr:acetylcholinesterase-like [Lytechinus pictus]